MFKNIGFILSFFLISSAAVWGQATSDVYYQWGNKLYVQGNYDLCIKYYKAAIQVDPQNWKAYQALGSCEYHLGQKDQAIQDFNQSLALNPNNPPLQNFVNRISPPTPPPTMAMAPRPEYKMDALPKKGSITWNLMVAADLDSYDDFTNYYGSITAEESPVGAEVGLGADYTFSPSFQLGLNFEFMDKVTDPVNYFFPYDGYLYPAVDQWQDICLGPAVDAKYLIPLSREFTFIIRGEGGYYFLTGSSLITTITDGYVTDTLTTNFNSSSIGGLIGVELEWMRGPGWAVDLGLGYRFLSFSTLNYNTTDTLGAFSGSGIFRNIAPPNANASMDFSGFNITSAIRFF